MKLRTITLNNVRRFTAPVTLAQIGDGLNVLSEPNEHGKSTLFDAIYALFFKAYGANDKEIKALKPHAGGAPEVTIEVETPEGRFVIFKRWTSKAQATVHKGGTLIAQADAAEAWISNLTGTGAGGPSGLVWVRQGLTGLTDGSKNEQAAALEARRDLMSSVSEEVEAMTGGRRMDAALARCKTELAQLATATGQKKAGGAWRTAFDRVEELRAQKTELAATAQALHSALQDRHKKRRALAELADPAATAARKDRLDAATAAHQEAARHAEQVENAARKVAAAKLAVTAARTRLDALRAAQTERDAAAQAAAQTAADRSATSARFAAAQEAANTEQTRLDGAEVALRGAQADQARLDRQMAARAGAQRRAELTTRIAEAEAARAVIETHAAAAKAGPDRAAVQRLEQLAAALSTARATRDALATQVIVTYAAGRGGAVQLDGAALDGGTPYPIPRGGVLQIAGLGDVEIRPGANAQDTDAVPQAQQALAQALAALDLPDIAAARAAADVRAQAVTATGEARARLDALAPGGIDALREALAQIPEAATDDAPLDPAATAAQLAAAQDAAAAAQSASRTAAEALANLRAELAGAEVARQAAQDRLARAEAAMAGFGTDTEAGLAQVMATAQAELAEAEAAHAAQSTDAPDLAGAEAALARARSIEAAAHAEIAQLRPQIATLDERIAIGAGDAVAERLAECEQQLAAAEQTLARYDHEVAVLQRLAAALTDARVAARERYFAPVAAELKPLLHLLWPQADLTWTQDTLLPEKLIRDGQEEPLDILSGGTQEQIALLVRLAFARMLERGGQHAPVLLDDALVYTDDDRIERMFDALHRQAGDLQIIVFSCRQRAFRDLGGTRLQLQHGAA
ncbi:chromosome segregation protein SMC [Loktanella salsilacus]|uniref:AAA family ATPase n=1 Tax=Loktanella salsilacus TaxID=195913 RepID=UPI0037352030